MQFAHPPLELTAHGMVHSETSKKYKWHFAGVLKLLLGIIRAKRFEHFSDDSEFKTRNISPLEISSYMPIALSN